MQVKEVEYQEEYDEVDPNKQGNYLKESSLAEPNDNGKEQDNKDGNEEAKPEADKDDQQPRCSTRECQAPNILMLTGKSYTQLQAQSTMIECDTQEARCLTNIMCTFNERMDIQKTKHGAQFVITYSLKKAIHKWGEQVN